MFLRVTTALLAKMPGQSKWGMDGLKLSHTVSHEARSGRIMTSKRNDRRLTKKQLIVLISSGLIAFVMLFTTGCTHPRKVIPNLLIPHQVAHEVEVYIYATDANGSERVEKITLQEGWWIASPLVIE